MKGDNIAERLLEFAVAVLRVTTKLPTSSSGRHVVFQLARFSTAGGVHYEETRGAESQANFVHKIRLAAKEVGESCYWLNVIQRAKLLDADVCGLLREASNLAAILLASAKTARIGGNE